MFFLQKLEVRLKTILLLVFGLLNASFAIAAQCLLEQGSETVRVDVPASETSLVGQWTKLGKFRVRTALSAPSQGKPRLLVEVYAKAADKDVRIISSQTIESPFGTGRVEIVEPRLGRSLTYECKEDAHE